MSARHTQLVLGVDRDSARPAHLFDERRPSVKRMIRDLIIAAHAAGRPVGICGQAPSDHPEFAAFLVECGIDSISLNPDSVVAGLRAVAEAEGRASLVVADEVGDTPDGQRHEPTPDRQQPSAPPRIRGA